MLFVRERPMKFKHILAQVLLVGSLMMANQALAQTPSDTSLIELAKITDVEQGFKDGMKMGFINGFSHSVLDDSLIQQLPPAKLAQLEKLTADFGERIWQEIDTTTLSKKAIEDFLAVAKKHYTQQEVEAMIDFYKTPVGQSIVAKQSIVIDEYMNMVMTTMMNDDELKQAFEKASQKHQSDFKKQVQEILK